MYKYIYIYIYIYIFDKNIIIVTLHLNNILNLNEMPH